MIVIWIAAIVVFGIVEAVTVGLVSIWFVLGAVAGLLAAVLGAALWVQIVLFFVVQARVPSAMGAVSRMAEAKKLANEIQKSIIQQLLPVSGPGRHSS